MLSELFDYIKSKDQGEYLDIPSFRRIISTYLKEFCDKKWEDEMRLKKIFIINVEFQGGCSKSWYNTYGVLIEDVKITDKNAEFQIYALDKETVINYLQERFVEIKNITFL